MKTMCLCCGKEILSEDSSEIQNQWHKKCVKSFFGTNQFPEILISNEQLELLVSETVSKGFTIAGVQKKLSLHLSKEKETRLTIVGYPAGYILKPQVEEFMHLPEMERLVMMLAKVAGIKTVPNALVKLQDGFAYITKRIDRLSSKSGTELFAMEDFCQLSGRLTEEKYKSSYERCAKIISQYSSNIGLDSAELFYRLLFCFVTGNSDMHLKNFSLIEAEPKSRNFVLSPAYDLLPVTIVMPEDTEEFALTMNGKRANIRKADFLTFAQSCKIPENAAYKMINKLLSLKEKLLTVVADSFICESEKTSFMSLMTERMNRLS